MSLRRAKEKDAKHFGEGSVTRKDGVFLQMGILVRVREGREGQGCAMVMDCVCLWM